MFQINAPLDRSKTAVFGKLIVSLFIIFLLMGGCCRKTALERDYGNSWAYNEAIQIANPKASFDPTPATGLGPRASANAMGAYNKSFTGSKCGGGSSTTINLGGLTTAGSGGGGSGN